jgi:hypothetical protein
MSVRLVTPVTHRLPFDTARCAKTPQNWDCPLSRHCLRRIDKGRPEYQPFTQFKGGVKCDGFIDAEVQP